MDLLKKKLLTRTHDSTNQKTVCVIYRPSFIYHVKECVVEMIVSLSVWHSILQRV